MLTNLGQKSHQNFICEKCNFNTSHKSKYDRHLNTGKHKILTSTDEKRHNTLFICECGKSYKYRQSLSVHKKKCEFIKNNNNIDSILPLVKDTNSNEELKSLVCKLINENNEIKNSIMKENNELRAQVSELIPKVGNNNTINNNQKLNINIFLNEQTIEKYKFYCILVKQMNKIKNDYKNKKIPDNIKNEFTDLDNEKNNYKKLINNSMSKIEDYVKILQENNNKEYNEFYLKAVYENSRNIWKFVKH